MNQSSRLALYVAATSAVVVTATFAISTFVVFVSARKHSRVIYQVLRRQVGNSMVNDPISDLIIRIKNAGMVSKAEVALPYSKLKHAVADTMVKAGFLTKAEKHGKSVQKELVVTLKYTERGHVIHDVKRISKPGRRLYVKAAEIHGFKYGKGSLILSTPKGILTDKEAKAANVGGEQLFTIW